MWINMCADMDECDEQYVCNKNETCVNTFGSYECNCLDGYQGDSCDQGKFF